MRKGRRSQWRLTEWERQFIIDYARAGASKRWIARNLLVSLNTVNRYWPTESAAAAIGSSE